MILITRSISNFSLTSSQDVNSFFFQSTFTSLPPFFVHYPLVARVIYLLFSTIQTLICFTVLFTSFSDKSSIFSMPSSLLPIFLLNSALSFPSIFLHVWGGLFFLCFIFISQSLSCSFFFAPSVLVVGSLFTFAFYSACFGWPRLSILCFFVYFCLPFFHMATLRHSTYYLILPSAFLAPRALTSKVVSLSLFLAIE